MSTALCTKLPNEDVFACPVRQAQARRWLTDLPKDLQAVVVPPVSVDVFHEYEIQAERAQGRDSANAPCFSEFRYVITQLRSDDDEEFYETPVYAEILTSWRLIDERWLVCRTTLDRLDRSGTHTSFSVSECIPR
jgi:hypothetical protein